MQLNPQKSYDFIFLGAGCASLSIVMRMIDSGKFGGNNFLLIDKESKNKNDRTWCFWEKGNGYFEELVQKKWNDLLFKTDTQSLSLDIAPYQYKMIRGIDFYNYCFAKILYQTDIDIDIEYGDIALKEDGSIKISGKPLLINKATVFNSIYLASKKQKNNIYLLQHFKGWIIETPTGQFNPAQGTLMDFSTSQDYGTAFVYVLPLAANRALIEYTLFTENVLPQKQYDLQLENYIEHHLSINNYKVIEEEYGVIPMTSERFEMYKNGLYNIGTAGGQTKASTGYTFQYIQKHSAQVVEDIILKKDPAKRKNNKQRFQFYDSTLLHILSKNKLPGKEIFTQLFQNNKAADVFKFLDNETTLKEELPIINTLPKKPFLIAGTKELLKYLNIYV